MLSIAMQLVLDKLYLAYFDSHAARIFVESKCLKWVETSRDQFVDSVALVVVLMLKQRFFNLYSPSWISPLSNPPLSQ